jgi:6-phosphogluconate dehydrogenase
MPTQWFRVLLLSFLTNPNIDMQIGLIGLGKMGANMARRLLEKGHQVIGFDVNEAAVSSLQADGGGGALTLESLVEQLDAPRHLWMMVPAGTIVDQTVAKLIPLLEAGDVLIDGGNSNYKETLRRAAEVNTHDIHYLDTGVSGGVWGRTEGYGLMIGGPTEAVERMRIVFEDLAPAPDKGWGHVGPVGAGHFVKMIHNGIEYGAMQAFAEGFAVMEAKKEFNLDLAQVAEVWRYGSVIRSWLLDLTARALGENPDLDGIAPYVSDSGEGRWTVKEAIDLDVPAPVMTLALIERFQSREPDSYAFKLLAALRNQFGGHAIKKDED